MSSALHSRRHIPLKTFGLGVGRCIEEIAKMKHGRRLLECIDVLVDGPFIEELKDISLEWRGSSNQRIINMHQWREAHPTFIEKMLRALKGFFTIDSSDIGMH